MNRNTGWETRYANWVTVALLTTLACCSTTKPTRDRADTIAPGGNYTINHDVGNPDFDHFIVENMNFSNGEGFDIRFRDIPLAAGDVVSFDWQGCVNRGGAGLQCYRYGDPLDAIGRKNNMYYGTVGIKGPTAPSLPTSTSLQDIARTAEYRIDALPADVPPHQIHIGYKDDQHSDNSNVISDWGYYAQCKDWDAAKLFVSVFHKKPPMPSPPPRDFDVVSNTAFGPRYDGNGWIVNPVFSRQNTAGLDSVGDPARSFYTAAKDIYGEAPAPAHFPPIPGDITDAPYFLSAIHGMAKWADRRHEISSQSPTAVWSQWCPARFPPDFSPFWLTHVQYFPVSYVTDIKPDIAIGEVTSRFEKQGNYKVGGGAGELDFNLNLFPFPAPIRGWMVHMEVDEPSLAFATQPFWNDVFHAVRTGAADSADLENRRAFVTGIFNIDTFHAPAPGDLQVESHPGLAAAISELRADELNSSKAEETWHVFVRNHGQGGYCDQENEYYFDLRLEDGGDGPEYFSFDLPLDDWNEQHTVQKVEIVSTTLDFKSPLHRLLGGSPASVRMIAPRLARLTLRFDRSADPAGTEDFAVIGDVRLKYTWAQGYPGK
jgi:hypothetical protein